MNIAVIAADGRSGRIFTEAALDAGHSIKAGVYRSNPFDDNPELEVVQCDATKPEDIANVINGQDAVVSLIGHGRKTKPDVQTQAIKLIIETMKKQNVSRLISLTGTGVRLEGDKITYIDRLLNYSIQHIDPSRVKDGIAHAKLLKNSDLDWTLLRVLKLGNGQPSSFSLKEHGPAKLLTPRTEVALAILETLEGRSFIKKAPVIGSGRKD